MRSLVVIFKMVDDKVLSRKQRRKEERKFKKLRKNAFRRGEKIPKLEEFRKNQLQAKMAAQKEEQKQKIRARKKLLKKRRGEKNKQEKLNKEQEMKERILEEEKELKSLEKNLKMKKGTRSAAFQKDQLDYLLDYQEDADLFRQAYEKGASLPLAFNKKEEDAYLKDAEGDEEDEEDDDSDDFFAHDDDDSEDEDEETDVAASDIKVISEPVTVATRSILKRSAKEESESAPSSKRLRWGKLAGESDDEDDSVPEEDAETHSHNSDEEEENSSNDNDSGDDKETFSGDESEEESESDVEEEQTFKKRKGMDGADEESNSDENEFNEDEDGGSDEGDEDKSEEEKAEETDAVLKEDIYGRLRDAEGRVVSGGEGKYIPPARRALLAMAEDKGRAARLERLKKSMKGLVNRANDSNIQSIANQIEEIYNINSRSDVNETLHGLVFEAVVEKSLTPEHIVNVLGLLIAILHGNVGTEVGAFFVQKLATTWWELFQQREKGESKEIDNILVLFASLYNFKVVGHEAVFDILKKNLEAFGEKEIELLLLMLRTCGFSLRKDSPLQLKEVVLTIQTQAASTDTSSFQDPSRVQWLLETLLAIRNNNVRKIPNYNPEAVDHLKKLARQYIRGASLGANELRVSLQDLLNAEHAGKWWMVGSAWQGRETTPEVTQSASSQADKSLGKFQKSLLKLARQQKMNTETRRNIFCIVMASQDFHDAYQKLMQLGLAKEQEGEMLAVIMDIAQQCKQYNPFYAHLLHSLAQNNKHVQRKLQLLWWDKFPDLSTLPGVSRQNLSQTLAHLLLTSALNLNVFKTIQFGMLDSRSENFFCATLKAVLCCKSKRTLSDIFKKASKEIGQGLIFLLEKRLSNTPEEDTLLHNRVQYVLAILEGASL